MKVACAFGDDHRGHDELWCFFPSFPETAGVFLERRERIVVSFTAGWIDFLLV